MTPLVLVMLVLLAAVETLAAYISRVYSEFGKILSREVQENLDAWENHVEPLLGLSREHAALCAAILQQLALGIIALEFGALLFNRAPHLGPPTYGEIAQAVLAVILIVIFCNQFFALAPVQPHAWPVGRAPHLARSDAPLDGHAHQRLHPLLLLRRRPC